MPEIRHVPLSATIPPFSDSVRMAPLPNNPRLLVGLSSWGTYNPGFISSSLWLSPNPTSSPLTDPDVLMVEPSVRGLVFNPTPKPFDQRYCLPIPYGYRYVYGEFCNATGSGIFLSHVIRVSL